ncbi:MAG TPA: hypothetical protein DEB39_07185 [Planctomycetaceae bacterium]|nr:hypothetical protein [Planctomycetaceae bacterium]
MIDVSELIALQQIMVARWHDDNGENANPHNGYLKNDYEGFLRLVCEQHKRNYLLWHQEDIARSPDVTDEEIARVKRNIDRLNQERNDHIELVDSAIISLLTAGDVGPVEGATLNTETPGSAIDRLSIMALRMYHMEEQIARKDASPEHHRKASDRLARCIEQHRDLSTSLEELLMDIFAGRKHLKVYHQFKMYNDPTMNPYLYRKKQVA